MALVADNSQRSFYIDGILQGQASIAKPFDRDRGRVLLGGSQGKRAALDGLLDEITWYDRALDANEVKNLAQSLNRSVCLP